MKLKKIGVLFIMLMVSICTFTACASSEYNKALKLMEQDKYEEAEAIFTKISDYKDSSELINECRYQIALEYFVNKKYEEAIEIFQSLGDYESSHVKVEECRKEMANSYFESRDYKAAILIFEELGDDEAIRECKWGIALDYFSENEVSSKLGPGVVTIISMSNKDGLVVNYNSNDSSSKLNFIIKKENPNLVSVNAVYSSYDSGTADVNLGNYTYLDELDWNGLSYSGERLFNIVFSSSYERFKSKIDSLGITLEDLGIGCE